MADGAQTCPLKDDTTIGRRVRLRSVEIENNGTAEASALMAALAQSSREAIAAYYYPCPDEHDVLTGITVTPNPVPLGDLAAKSVTTRPVNHPCSEYGVHWRETGGGIVWYDGVRPNGFYTREMWPGTFTVEAWPVWGDGHVGSTVTTTFSVLEPTTIEPEGAPPYQWIVTDPTIDPDEEFGPTGDDKWYATYTVAGQIDWIVKDSGGNLVRGPDVGPPMGHAQYGVWRVEQKLYRDSPPNPGLRGSRTLADPDEFGWIAEQGPQSYTVNDITGYGTLVADAPGTVKWCGHYQFVFWVYNPQGGLWATYQLSPTWYIAWVKHGPAGAIVGGVATPPDSDDMRMELTDAPNPNCP